MNLKPLRSHLYAAGIMPGNGVGQDEQHLIQGCFLKKGTCLRCGLEYPTIGHSPCSVPGYAFAFPSVTWLSPGVATVQIGDVSAHCLGEA